MLIVPSLIALARESAPGITLQIANISANLAQALDQQQVDIALGAFDRVPPSLRSEVLFRDEKAWATGTHHPLAKQPFDHATVLAWLRLAIGIGSAGLKSREPPAGNDLVLRLILRRTMKRSHPDRPSGHQRRVHDDPGSLWLRTLIREAVNLSSDAARPRGSVNRTNASASAGKKAKKGAGSDQARQKASLLSGLGG